MSSWAESRVELLREQASGGAAAQDSGVVSARAGADWVYASEWSSTQLSADLLARYARPRKADDRGGLSVRAAHSLSDGLNTWSVDAAQRVDSMSNVRESAADAGLGAGRRRSRSAATAWNRALDERWNARLAGSWTSTQYGQDVDGAVDFDNRSLTSALTWRASESDALSLQVATSAFRPEPPGLRSGTASLSLSWQRALGASDALGLSIGGYRVRSRGSFDTLACPLPVGFCLQGLVPFAVVTREFLSKRTGTQASANLTRRLDERRGMAMSASRQLSPSGSGTVVTEDQIALSVDQAVGDRTTLRAGGVLSRSTFEQAAGPGQARQNSAWVSLEHTFSEDIRVVFEGRRAHGSSTGAPGSDGTRWALTLRWQGPTSGAMR